MDNYNNYIIKNNTTIKEAYDKINENEHQIVFVVDNDEKLLFSITDGDIRRYLLSNNDLNNNVMELKKECISSPSIQKAKLLCKEYKVVPVIDNLNHISILVFNNYILPKQKINIPVVIQAGGLGTRLYPYTKILPKPLIPIGDYPIIELIINRFVEFGCSEFYIIVNHKKEMIKSYFSEIEYDYNITFIDEAEPLGTAGGLSLLDGKINTPFILTNCDTLLDCDFITLYNKHTNSDNEITMVCADMKFQIPYGTLKIDDNEKLTELIEKPIFSFLSNVGCYIVNPTVIDKIPKNTKIHFTTICEQYQNLKQVGIYKIHEDEWHDMGEIDKLNRMI